MASAWAAARRGLGGLTGPTLSRGACAQGGLPARARPAPWLPPAARGRTRAQSSAPPGVRGRAVPPPTKQQLTQLALASAVPFIGFGFADNLIMIVAGDAIDASLGVSLGLTTMAAAGFGNLISDVAGLGLGGAIEGMANRTGLKMPKLSAEQQELSRTRWVKGVSGALGLSIGCILGMFPLLLGSRKHQLYFTEEEELLYQTHFQRYGVSPQQFFELMRHARWRSAEPGAVLVEGSKKLPKVLMLFEGVATVRRAPDQPPSARFYEGRHQAGELKPASAGGCIIGGTALVDSAVVGKPYPNSIVAAAPTRWVEWDTGELKKTMNEDPAIEAAVLQTLYTDLLQGLRLQRKSTAAKLRGAKTVREGGEDRVVSGRRVVSKLSRAGEGFGEPEGNAAAVAAAAGAEGAAAVAGAAAAAGGGGSGGGTVPPASAPNAAAGGADAARAPLARADSGRAGGGGLARYDTTELDADGNPRSSESAQRDELMYTNLLKAILADEVVHPVERMLVGDYMRAKGISAEVHRRCLGRVGWSEADWRMGVRMTGHGAGGGAAGAGAEGDGDAGHEALPTSARDYLEFVRRGKNDLHRAQEEWSAQQQRQQQQAQQAQRGAGGGGGG